MSWIITAALGIAGAALAYRHWPRSRQALYEQRLAELQADMESRGLTQTQQIEEMSFRRAMAKLRRRASDAVMQNPTGEVRTVVSSLAVEISKEISDKDVARRFLKVVQDAPFGDILYADALKAITSVPRKSSIRHVALTDDEIAAVTKRR